MGKIKNKLIEAMETPIMDVCSECDGLGQVFYEVARPQGFGMYRLRLVRMSGLCLLRCSCLLASGDMLSRITVLIWILYHEGA